MPIYAYKCDSCGGLEEHIQKIEAPPPEEGCQECGSALKKILTTAAVLMGKHAAVSRGSGKGANQPPADSGARGLYNGLMEAAQAGPDAAHEYVSGTGGASHEYRHVGGSDD